MEKGDIDETKIGTNSLITNWNHICHFYYKTEFEQDKIGPDGVSSIPTKASAY